MTIEPVHPKWMKKVRLPLALYLASQLLLAGCGTVTMRAGNGDVDVRNRDADQRPVMMGTAEEAKWDAVLARWIAHPKLSTCDAPGAVLLVDSPAGRYLKAAGVSSVDSGRAVQVGDRFQVGSNTKSFTVALALQLQEDGVLSMDDLLSRWLPGVAARIPNGNRVTLRQLAGSTSGIRDYADELMMPVIEKNDRAGLQKTYAPSELVDFALTTGAPDFEPGTGWKYSSTNFILLGMVVEVASGRSLSALFRERIFDALGMASSSYLEGSAAPGSIVNGYFTVPGQQRIDVTAWNATQGGAAGAIVSTAEDMARFAKGLMGGAIFRKRSTLDEMLSFTELAISQGGALMSGYGLGLISFRTTGFRAIGHAGQTPGFQTVWFVVPEADSRVVFLTNSGSCPAEFLPVLLPPDYFSVPKRP